MNTREKKHTQKQHLPQQQQQQPRQRQRRQQTIAINFLSYENKKIMDNRS